jgi:hypothetical protein
MPAHDDLFVAIPGLRAQRYRELGKLLVGERRLNDEPACGGERLHRFARTRAFR